MQTKVELKNVAKFTPVEITISLRIDSQAELSELLEDKNKLSCKRVVCNDSGVALSDVSNSMIQQVVSRLSEALE